MFCNLGMEFPDCNNDFSIVTKSDCKSAAAEIDLVMEGPGNSIIAIEIKRSSSPRVCKEFHSACENMKATRKLEIYAGTDRFSMRNNTEATGLTRFLSEFAQLA